MLLIHNIITLKMTVLDQQKDLDNLNIISAITYLLSIVFPKYVLFNCYIYL